jgi:hypothetical protein
MMVPCKATTCRACAALVATKRGARLAESLGNTPLAAVVLTLPPGRDGTWGYLSWGLVRTLRRLAWLLVAAWARDTWGISRIGGYVACHPAGDKCRKCGHEANNKGAPPDASVRGACTKCGAETVWRPHFHLGFPLVGLDRANQARELAPWVHEARLDALRTAWGAVLAALLPGQSVTPVVHYSFKQTAESVGHRLRYDWRPWPAWGDRANLASISTLRVIRYGLAAGNAANADNWREIVRREVQGPPEGGEAEIKCVTCGDIARYLATVCIHQVERGIRIVFPAEEPSYAD